MASEAATGHHSVAFPRRWWYPACASADLGSTRPLGVTLMDTPLALFRDAGAVPHALVDRCPHRNVPLSLGRVHPDGCLECGYHGWRFDGAGACAEVPGLQQVADPTAATARQVPAFPTREQDGFVWVWADPATEPDKAPFRLPVLEGPRRNVGEVVLRFDLDATVHASVENALDVPHTAFLHRGIFRGGDTRELTAIRRAGDDHVEVQYLGEPVGLGPLRGSQSSELTFDHWDRFFLPAIAQVEYRVKDWLTIVNTILHLPLSPNRTRAWFVVRFRTPVPAAVARPIVFGRGWQIARQDVGMLRAQTANTARFGGERYTSTDLDLFGNAVWRLLRDAERRERPDTGASPPAPVEIREKHVTFRV